MEIVTILILGAIAMTAAGAKKTSKKLEFIPTGITVTKKTRAGAKRKLSLQMDILNPTKKRVAVKSLYVSIYANESKIGRVERFTPFTIAPQARTAVKFPITISAAGLGKMIADKIRGKTVTFKALGIVNVFGMDQPIDEIIDFEL